ncbi:MAG: hypothetical protein KJ077_25975 [Anaerolineae bacterium]|nr:hypothetical protein [Anaerolineae bacterium]
MLSATTMLTLLESEAEALKDHLSEPAWNEFCPRAADLVCSLRQDTC